MTNLFLSATDLVSNLFQNPDFVDFLRFSKDSLLIWLEAFNFAFTLRFTLMWFPNINPFIQPYYIVRVITEPYLGFVQKRLPRLFGVDVSFLVCSLLLGQFIDFLRTIKL